MVNQVIPLASIVDGFQRFANETREFEGTDLLEATAPIALVIDDLITYCGLPIKRLVLTPDELADIGPGQPLDYRLVCACCQAEATQLAPTRRGKLLLCDDHAQQLRIDL